MLLTAIITITLALVFYSVGVFMEHRSKKLTFKHLGLFLAGLIFDTTGTFIMSGIAEENQKTATGMNWNAFTGFLAIMLMAFHASWALLVLMKKDRKSQQKFHKFSLIVWLIWLVPYISGVFVGMN